MLNESEQESQSSLKLSGYPKISLKIESVIDYLKLQHHCNALAHIQDGMGKKAPLVIFPMQLLPSMN